MLLVKTFTKQENGVKTVFRFGSFSEYFGKLHNFFKTPNNKMKVSR